MPSDNEGKFYWLLDRIVRREGIGDVLADGTYWAAKRIGNGAEEFAHNNIKKQEQLPLKLGMLNPVYFLMYSTGEKINITQIEGQFPQAPFIQKRRRKILSRTGSTSRMTSSRNISASGNSAENSPIRTTRMSEASCDIVDWQEMMHYIDDAARGVRRFVLISAEAPLSHPQLPGIHLRRDRDSAWMKPS